MSRFFFALDISPQDKQVIEHWRAKALALPFKAIAQQNYHITLAFLGAIEQQALISLMASAQHVAAQLRPVNPKVLLLDQVGLFHKAKVLYLGIRKVPHWLSDLAKQLSCAATHLIIFQEKRPYHAHMSLYRKASQLTDEVPAPNIKIEVTSFSLYQSVSSERGVKYKPVKTWALTCR